MYTTAGLTPFPQDTIIYLIVLLSASQKHWSEIPSVSFSGGERAHSLLRNLVEKQKNRNNSSVGFPTLLQDSPLWWAGFEEACNTGWACTFTHTASAPPPAELHALHTPPTQIPTPWPLHLPEATAASTFGTPQLNFMSRPVFSPARALLPASRAGVQGLPCGPTVLPGDSSSPGPCRGAVSCYPPRERAAGTGGTPAQGGDCSQSKLQRCQEVKILSSSYFFLSFPLTASLWLFFFGQIIPGNSYFCKNSDIIPIRW